MNPILHHKPNKIQLIMNKKLLFILLLFAGMANAQIVTIPDAAFKAKLLSADVTNEIAEDALANPIKIDTNNDGEIQTSEALTVYKLRILNDIVLSATGISSFTNLRQLEFFQNPLLSLDVSALTNLTHLKCAQTLIPSLNLSGLTNLKSVFCENNPLTTLNVNGLVNLQDLYCAYNQLTTLNLTSLTNLRLLMCSENPLTSLNVSGLSNLNILITEYTSLSTLNLSGLTNLKMLSCGGNNLTSLNVSGSTMLEQLHCSNNLLTSLNVSALTQLTNLNCFYNQISNLDLSNATGLTNLSCGENNISVLNLNGLAQLTALECSYLPNNLVINGTGLTALTYFTYVGSNSDLTLNGFPNLNSASIGLTQPIITLNVSGFNPNATLYVGNNNITGLTVNGTVGTSLGSLYSSNGQLTNLTLNNLVNLRSLNCSNNQLTTLSLTNLPDLTNLEVGRNKLTSLDLTNLPNLKHLDCNNNKISNLNLTALPALEYLNCSNYIDFGFVGNQITALDLSGLPNLKHLDCSNYAFNGSLGAAGNVISSLDVNNLTQLEVLKFNKNQVATLNVNGLTQLTDLDCSFNHLTDLDLSGLTNLSKLDFSNNQLANVNLTDLINITELTCRTNAITTLNVTNMPLLRKLDCTANLLTTLNLTGLTQIVELNVQGNQLTTLDLSAMENLYYFNCNSNFISNLDLSNLPNLNELHCVSNAMTNLNVSSCTLLQGLFCNGNQLTNLDLTPLTNLRHLNCEQNQLTSLNVSTLTNLLGLDFGMNQIASIDLTGLTSVYGIGCRNNLLTSLDVSNLPDLYSVDCSSNQITTLDVSNAAVLEYLRCNNNPFLTTLYMKNGASEGTIDVSNNPLLTYICADDAELATVQNQLNASGMTWTVCNSYCTLTPGGPHNTVIGTTIFDGNNNGCNSNDPLHPNIRIDFTDGLGTTGSAFTNSEGIVTFYAGAGNYTITPNIENAASFNISPASATINFPDDNNNIGNQSFCLSANGVHPDVEVVISTISPARPGFDADYEIVYKNKGNQVLSGNITFTFDDSRLDLITALPVADTQTTNNLDWTYSSLLPFESRSIALTFNVNAPTELPAVNNGDLLTFAATITPDAGDETPLDNAFNFNQIVVGAFDPNNIICLEGASVAPTEIGNYLHYVVNFENTGTAAAENVVVNLVIDPAEFDITTLQIINTSHEAFAEVRDNVAEFKFPNINLQPTAGDPPVNGHGNILFKMKSRTSLLAGDAVTNKADIYFDYNFPIETEDAETVFAALSSSVFTKDDSITMYPNPANDFVHIKSDTNITLIELFDIQGRIIETRLESTNAVKLDISDKANGIYFLRITTEEGKKVEKLVKE